jgi:hypothetical protein
MLWKNHIEEAEEIATVAKRWLIEVPNENGSWGYIWSAMWEKYNGEYTLKILARKWLFKVPSTHGSWSFVWQELFKFSHEDLGLFNLGLRSIKNMPHDHESWVFIWGELWKQRSGHPNAAVSIEAMGRQWLVTASASHASWGYLWQALWKHTQGDKELAKIALSWLENAPAEHGAWSIVWQALWRHKVQRDLIRQPGITWLEKVPNHKSWAHHWLTLWESEKSTELSSHFVELARKWLRDESIRKTSGPLYRQIEESVSICGFEG